MRVLVCGGRHYTDREQLAWVLAKVGATVIIEPGTLGAPYLAAEWARQKGLEVRTHVLDAARHGSAAGVIRKEEMILDRPDLVVVFPGDDLFSEVPQMAREAGIDVLLAEEISPLAQLEDDDGMRDLSVEPETESTETPDEE